MTFLLIVYSDVIDKFKTVLFSVHPQLKFTCVPVRGKHVGDKDFEDTEIIYIYIYIYI